MTDPIHDLTQQIVEDERIIAQLRMQAQRAIDLTGGSAASLADALDQWENERQALAQLFDENTALTLAFRRFDVILLLAERIVGAVETDAAMFITAKTRNTIAEFRDQVYKLQNQRALGRQIKDDSAQRPAPAGERKNNVRPTADP